MQRKILHIFDVDGTLFRSPCDTPENRRKFEKATGLPWLIDKELSRTLTAKHKRFIPVRRGWWGRPETLEPPIVADPAPQEWFIQDTVESLFVSKQNPEIITLIMTGRHTGLQNQVLRILSDGNLLKVEKTVSKRTGDVFFKNVDPNAQFFCLGMDGPIKDFFGAKPTETFPWKVWIIEQFCLAYPIENIEIWEDREEHVEKFTALNIGPVIKVNTVIS